MLSCCCCRCCERRFNTRNILLLVCCFSLAGVHISAAATAVSSTSVYNSSGLNATKLTTRSMTVSTTTTPATLLPCTATELNRTTCSNTGVCVAIETASGQRTITCRCLEPWTGVNCESRVSLNETSHEYKCTATEVRSTACLNGGKCFAMRITDHWSAACICQPKFHGKRCEMKQLPPDLDSASLTYIAIAILIGVAAAVSIVVILCWKKYHCIERLRSQPTDRLESTQLNASKTQDSIATA